MTDKPPTCKACDERITAGEDEHYKGYHASQTFCIQNLRRQRDEAVVRNWEHEQRLIKASGRIAEIEAFIEAIAGSKETS